MTDMKTKTTPVENRETVHGRRPHTLDEIFADYNEHETGCHYHPLTPHVEFRICGVDGSSIENRDKLDVEVYSDDGSYSVPVRDVPFLKRLINLGEDAESEFDLLDVPEAESLIGQIQFGEEVLFIPRTRHPDSIGFGGLGARYNPTELVSVGDTARDARQLTIDDLWISVKAYSIFDKGDDEAKHNVTPSKVMAYTHKLKTVLFEKVIASVRERVQTIAIGLIDVSEGLQPIRRLDVKISAPWIGAMANASITIDASDSNLHRIRESAKMIEDTPSRSKSYGHELMPHELSIDWTFRNSMELGANDRWLPIDTWISVAVPAVARHTLRDTENDRDVCAPYYHLLRCEEVETEQRRGSYLAARSDTGKNDLLDDGYVVWSDVQNDSYSGQDLMKPGREYAKREAENSLDPFRERPTVIRHECSVISGERRAGDHTDETFESGLVTFTDHINLLAPRYNVMKHPAFVEFEKVIAESNDFDRLYGISSIYTWRGMDWVVGFGFATPGICDYCNVCQSEGFVTADKNQYTFTSDNRSVLRDRNSVIPCDGFDAEHDITTTGGTTDALRDSVCGTDQFVPGQTYNGAIAPCEHYSAARDEATRYASWCADQVERARACNVSGEKKLRAAASLVASLGDAFATRNASGERISGEICNDDIGIEVYDENDSDRSRSVIKSIHDLLTDAETDFELAYKIERVCRRGALNVGPRHGSVMLSVVQSARDLIDATRARVDMLRSDVE